MDHHEKLAWSALHVHALDLEIKQFLQRNRFTARGEQRDGTRQFDIIVNDVPFLPSHWPLMAGDAIHNMRSALDHIIWALTERSPTQPNDKQRLKIGFPISLTKGQYFDPGNGARKRQAGWIGEEALAHLDRLQPFLKGNDVHEHPLAILAAYSNEDKHRKLVASAVLATSVQFTFKMTGTTRQQRITSAQFDRGSDWLYSGANLGVLEFAEGTTCDPGEMVVEPEFNGTIAFSMGEPTPPFNVQALEKLLDVIHLDVVAPLDKLL